MEDIFKYDSKKKNLNLKKEFFVFINLIYNFILNYKKIAFLVEHFFYKKNVKINFIFNKIKYLKFSIKNLEFESFFSFKYSFYNCYVDIKSGSGGFESNDWANILFKMYFLWSQIHNFKVKIIKKSINEVGLFKSVTLEIIGNYAYGWLRTETGIHRLVRKNPYNSKRHTSFCSIFVYPKINNIKNIDINLNDLRINFYRSSGCGGQHVNKTQSAVHIIHLPTKINVKCQFDRSQHINKKIALEKLKLKLNQFDKNKINKQKYILNYLKSDICWSNQIRSYILDDSRIKDLRTGLEIYNVQSVLNGSNLDKFIKTSLKFGL